MTVQTPGPKESRAKNVYWHTFLSLAWVLVAYRRGRWNMAPDNISPRPTNRSLVVAAALLGLLIAVGLAAIGLLANQSPSPFQVLAVGLVVSASSQVVGGLLGFIFALPHPIQRVSSTAREEPNSNLSQISDWVTKILVGIGLTQLVRIPAAAEALAEFLGPAFGGTQISRPFSVALVALSVSVGFLVSYLWTQVVYTPILNQRDKSLEEVQEKVNEVQEKVQSLATRQEEIAQHDAIAYRLVSLQLGAAGTKSPVSQGQLDTAIAQASPTAQWRIYSSAQSMRAATRDRKNGKMELTIPVFRALIKWNESSNIMPKEHVFHAQLGYALKDQATPAWWEAEHELRRAIEIRGTSFAEDPAALYELNRAVCRIVLGFQAEDIKSDLRAVFSRNQTVRGKVQAQLEKTASQGTPEPAGSDPSGDAKDISHISNWMEQYHLAINL